MNLLAQLPRSLLVALVLIVSLVLILYANPPHTPCDSQIEVFKETQKTRLFAQEVKGIQERARLGVLEKACKETNSSGGCYELFLALRQVADAANDIPSECGDKILEVSELTAAINRGLALMIKLAWGEAPPASVYVRNGWLESTDLVLFCRLVDLKSKFEGSEKWQEMRNQILMSLPGAETVGFTEAFKRSIVSTDCRAFL